MSVRNLVQIDNIKFVNRLRFESNDKMTRLLRTNGYRLQHAWECA